MALPSPALSRQAPRTRPAPSLGRRTFISPTSVEDDRFEEVEEPAPVETVKAPPRITVNGVAVRRLQIDFGTNATAFCPSNGSTGSVMERFWDQHDGDPDKDKYSRPRPFSNARIEVTTSKGYLDLIASWDGAPGITRVVQPCAYLNYEPL